MQLWFCMLVLWSLQAEAKYYHMAYAGYRKDDPNTEPTPVDNDKDRMGVLYRAPSIYQPSYYHQAPSPIEESAEIETYPLEPYEHPVAAATAPPATAAPASPSEKRQQPYSYYYIGRKLWYIPLYFSLYFVIYVAALIIRAIARHKVTFPDRLPQPQGRNFEQSSAEDLDSKTADMNKLLDDMFLKYM